MVILCGYRSDIAICMYKKDFDDIVADAKVNCKEGYELLQAADNIKIMKREPEDIVVISWSELKWNEEYPDVDYIRQSLWHLVDIDRPYRLVRTGESYEDIEVDENYIDWNKDSVVLEAIYPVSYISIPEDSDAIDIKLD